MLRALGTFVAAVIVAAVLQPAASVARAPSLTPHPDRAARDVRSDYNASCYQKKADKARASYCKYGQRDARVKVAVVGDSKTKQYVSALDYAGRTRGWQIDVYSRTGCPLARYAPAKDRACTTWNKKVLDRVRDKDYDYVVTGLYHMTVPRSSTYSSFKKRHARFIEGVRAQIKAYQRSGGPRVILLNAGPMMKRDVPQCIRKNRSRPSTCDTKRSTALKPKQVWDAASRKALMRGLVPSKRIISLTGNICTSTTCRAVIGRKIVFRDKHHLTDTYVKNRRGFITRKLDRII